MIRKRGWNKLYFWVFGLHRRARVACAPDPQSYCFECFCTPAPFGRPWFPKFVPRAPWADFLGAFGWLCVAFGCPFVVPWSFRGDSWVLLVALCISWLLLGSSFGILAFLRASLFPVFVGALSQYIHINICIGLVLGWGGKPTVGASWVPHGVPSIDESISQVNQNTPINQTINQSVNESIHQLVHPSIKSIKSVRPSIHPSTSQSIHQAIKPSSNQSIYTLTSAQSIKPSINYSVNQAINHSSNESIIQMTLRYSLHFFGVPFRFL